MSTTPDRAPSTGAPTHPFARFARAARPGSAGVVYALVVLLVIMVVACAALGKPFYLNPTNVANILDQTANVGILALFMTIVLISGNFDLSVGSVAAFAAVSSLTVVDQFGLGGSIAIAIGSGIVFGLINGLIVEYLKVNAFIVTLGTMTAIRGLVLIITNGTSVGPSKPESIAALKSVGSSFVTLNIDFVIAAVLLIAGVIALIVRARRTVRRARSLTAPIVLLGLGALFVVLGFVAPAVVSWTASVWYMIILAAATWSVLRYTVVGRRIYAVGGNPEAARLSGIAVRRYRILSFVLTGAAAGFVGLLFASRLGSANPTALSGLELTVIAAAILGGTSLFGGSGNVLLSLVGALFLFTIANGFNVLNLGSNYQGLIQGVILIAAAATYTTALRTRRRKAAAPVSPAPTETSAPAQDSRGGEANSTPERAVSR